MKLNIPAINSALQGEPFVMQNDSRVGRREPRRQGRAASIITFRSSSHITAQSHLHLPSVTTFVNNLIQRSVVQSIPQDDQRDLNFAMSSLSTTIIFVISCDVFSLFLCLLSPCTFSNILHDACADNVVQMLCARLDHQS